MIYNFAYIGIHSLWEGFVRLVGNPEFLQDTYIKIAIVFWLLSTLIVKGLVESGNMAILGKRTRLSWFWSFVFGWLFLVYFLASEDKGKSGSK